MNIRVMIWFMHQKLYIVINDMTSHDRCSSRLFDIKYDMNNIFIATSDVESKRKSWFIW